MERRVSVACPSGHEDCEASVEVDDSVTNQEIHAVFAQRARDLERRAAVDANIAPLLSERD